MIQTLERSYVSNMLPEILNQICRSNLIRTLTTLSLALTALKCQSILFTKIPTKSIKLHVYYMDLHSSIFTAKVSKPHLCKKVTLRGGKPTQNIQRLR